MSATKTNPTLPEYDHSETGKDGVTTYTKGGVEVMNSRAEGNNQVISIINNGKPSAEYYVGKDSALADGVVVNNTIASGGIVRPFRRVEYTHNQDGTTTSTNYGYKSNGRDPNTTNYHVNSETVTNAKGEVIQKTVNDTYGTIGERSTVVHNAFTQTITAEYGADGKPTHSHYSVSGSDGKPVNSIDVTTNEDGSKTAHIKNGHYEYNATIGADGKITELTPANKAAEGLIGKIKENDAIMRTDGMGVLKQEMTEAVQQTEEAATKARTQTNPNENVFGNVPPLYNPDISTPAFNWANNENKLQQQHGPGDAPPTVAFNGEGDKLPLVKGSDTFNWLGNPPPLVEFKNDPWKERYPQTVPHPTLAQIAATLNPDNTKLPSNPPPHPSPNSTLTQVGGELGIMEFPAHKPEIPLYQRIREDGNDPSVRSGNEELKLDSRKIAEFLGHTGHGEDSIASAMKILNEPSGTLTTPPKPASLDLSRTV